jgi:hypothetical protein
MAEKAQTELCMSNWGFYTGQKATPRVVRSHKQERNVPRESPFV